MKRKWRLSEDRDEFVFPESYGHGAYLSRGNSAKRKIPVIVRKTLISLIILAFVLGIKSIDNRFFNKAETYLKHCLQTQYDYGSIIAELGAIKVWKENLRFSAIDLLGKEGEKKEINDVSSLNHNQNSRDNEVVPEASTIETVQEFAAMEGVKAIWPVLDGEVSSPFGMREHPVFKDQRFHEGVDIDAPEGTKVRAPLDGLVVEVFDTETMGKGLKIYHGSTIQTVYAHCSKVKVEKDQIVRQGDIIGEVGNTGLSTGPHLHFEVLVNDQQVDPIIWLQGENKQ